MLVFCTGAKRIVCIGDKVLRSSQNINARVSMYLTISKEINDLIQHVYPKEMVISMPGGNVKMFCLYYALL